MVESCLKWDIYSTVVWCNSVKDDCKQGCATVEGNDWNMDANKEDYQYPTFTNAVNVKTLIASAADMNVALHLETFNGWFETFERCFNL